MSKKREGLNEGDYRRARQMVGVEGINMSQANCRAASNNIPSPEGPLNRKGDETSCVFWQRDSAGVTQLAKVLHNRPQCRKKLPLRQPLKGEGPPAHERGGGA